MARETAAHVWGVAPQTCIQRLRGITIGGTVTKCPHLLLNLGTYRPFPQPIQAVCLHNRPTVSPRQSCMPRNHSDTQMPMSGQPCVLARGSSLLPYTLYLKYTPQCYVIQKVTVRSTYTHTQWSSDKCSSMHVLPTLGTVSIPSVGGL